jgi:hypothetical protein
MNFNLYIKTDRSEFNLLVISEKELEKVVDAYKFGKDSFFIQGEKYWIYNLFEIQIFTFENDRIKTGNELISFCRQNHWLERGFLDIDHYWIPKEFLEKFGKRVTDDFILDDFGYLKDSRVETTIPNAFVDLKRIDEIIQINSASFDFSKLIQILKELNIASSNSMFLSIPLLIRAIIDHVPPIFSKSSFADVCGSHGSRSFKDNMLNLEKSSRKIADSFLHTQIRNKETLPTIVQVNFKQDLDVLLMEIVRLMKI